MNPLLQKILNRYQKQADDDGSDLPGGDADYGDDFTPTDDGAEDAPAAKDDAGDGPAAADEDLRAAAEELEEGAEEAKKTGTPKSGKGKFIPLDRHEKLLKPSSARAAPVSRWPRPTKTCPALKTSWWPWRPSTTTCWPRATPRPPRS